MARRRSSLLLAALPLTVLTAVLTAAQAGGQEPAAPPAGPPAAEVPAAVPVPPARASPAGDVGGLPARYWRWLEDVDLLISEEERQAFLRLGKNYQRDAFIERFWRERDPYPETARNELRERWTERVSLARSRFRRLDDDRSRMLLLNGPPVLAKPVLCHSSYWPIETWFYPDGSDVYRDSFALVFYQKGSLASPYRLWQPGFGEAELFRLFRVERDLSCPGLGYLNGAMRLAERDAALAYSTLLARLDKHPAPADGEWVATFSSYSTDLPDGADTFDAGLDLDFPGWYQNRTVVQGLVRVPLAAAAVSELAGHTSYDFLLTGEVLADGRLFDSFRYKFDLPASGASATLPLAFQRYLRPGGPYSLVLKIEDLASKRFCRIERRLTVPRVTGTELPPPADPETAHLLAEANAALAAGETTIKIVPPLGDLLAGLVRFDTLSTGGDIERVTFSLDGHAILTKTRPPWSVELDLGSLPRTHVLRVAAAGADGGELASDELLVNASAHRFRIRLVEPARGRHFEHSLRARAEVEVPEDQAIARVELYLGESRVATLFQPPWVQPIVLPDGDPPGYVRAVAYDTDGASTEDLVMINSGSFGEEVDVQLVELYASVLDRQGRPVDDLAKQDFTVSEDGAPQQVLRFEQVRDRAIHAAILLDVSASMDAALDEARTAALSFFRSAIRPKDRAALITFNDRPSLAVKFTNDVSTFAGGLAGLKAERGTALYDSVIYSLFYFTGVKGQRALLVLSDGKDEGSRFSFEETLDYARRAGVTLYAVGLGPARRDATAKKRLTRLADETGGRSYFIDKASELAAVYAEIEHELRGQYLIAYQSTHTGGAQAFRSIAVSTPGRGLEVKTLSGYYP